MKILTFDIEEWFHLLDTPTTKTEKEWETFEVRIHKNMEKIFDILNTSKTDATFFVVGWIAQKYPEVVREISDMGYEIGSHTHMHQLVYEQNRNEFYQDVEKSIKTLEDITGKKVVSFRAPGFSITESNLWAFEVLHELGIEVDSSVFPSGRAHGGMPSYGIAKPSILEYQGIKLKEFPINTHIIFGKPIIFSGGGYFRILPYSIINSWTRKSDYVMTYFHPRDFDYEQPLVSGLSLNRRFKSYVGLKGCKNKLLKIIKDFDFISLEAADKMLDWRSVPRIEL